MADGVNEYGVLNLIWDIRDTDLTVYGTDGKTPLSIEVEGPKRKRKIKLELDGGSTSLLTMLASRASRSEGWTSFPSLATLAKDCRMSKSSVSTHLVLLEAMGLVSHVQRFNNSSLYYVNVGHIYKIAREQAEKKQAAKVKPVVFAAPSFAVPTIDTTRDDALVDAVLDAPAPTPPEPPPAAVRVIEAPAPVPMPLAPVEEIADPATQFKALTDRLRQVTFSGKELFTDEDALNVGTFLTTRVPNHAAVMLAIDRLHLDTLRTAATKENPSGWLVHSLLGHATDILRERRAA